MSADEFGDRHLVLVGLMGVGKTTVGKGCAARLGRAFVDTDDLVIDPRGHAVRRDLRDARASPRSARSSGRRSPTCARRPRRS